MIKKLSVLTLALSLLIPISAMAASFDAGYFGTTTESGFMAADGTNHDDYWLTLTVKGEGSGKVLWYGSGGSSAGSIGSNSVPATVNAPDGAMWFKLVSDSGEIHATHATSTNPAATDVTFSSGGHSDGGGSDSGGGSSGGGSNSCTITNSCDVFSCPKWDEYMGKVNEIIDKIPNEPNWQNVAETFRDTIAPKIKSDMTNVINDTLGRAPDLPNVPSELPSTDDGGITAPTGKEADGLGDSSFSSKDIKNGAEDIEVREDDSGGFNIENPLETIKDPPIFKPKEDENKAPVPDEQENKAPVPDEQENKAPVPAEQEYEAPIPEGSDTDWSVPIPDDSNTEAPIPDEGEWEVPIPEDNYDSVPIPKQ